MSLDLQQVLPQVEHLGQEAARRAAEASVRLPRLAQSLLDAARLEPSELERRLAAAPSTAHPAGPTDESIDARFPLPPHPPRLRLLAADGSQVYPDRHAAAFFYMVNVGSIDLLQGSGRPPQIATRSDLHFHEDDLHDTRGLPVDTHLINARRDAAGERVRGGEGDLEAGPVDRALGRGVRGGGERDSRDRRGPVAVHRRPAGRFLVAHVVDGLRDHLVRAVGGGQDERPGGGGKSGPADRGERRGDAGGRAVDDGVLCGDGERGLRPDDGLARGEHGLRRADLERRGCIWSTWMALSRASQPIWESSPT